MSDERHRQFPKSSKFLVPGLCPGTQCTAGSACRQCPHKSPVFEAEPRWQRVPRQSLGTRRCSASRGCRSAFFILPTFLAACAVFGACNSPAHGDAARDVAQLTNAHTRVVWVQDQSAPNDDSVALGQELKLMGFDSQDGQGERQILGEVRNYAKP